MKLDLNAPHQTYRDSQGRPLVGTTTALGALGKDALIAWAAKVEREGCVRHLAEHGTLDTLPKPYFHKTESGDAKVLGSIVHARCEAWLKGMSLSPEGLPEGLYAASLAPYDRFRQWFDGAGLTPYESELQLSILDGAYEASYGGTIDFVAKDANGELVMGDIKTTGSKRGWPYPTVIAQVGAYDNLWRVNRDEGMARHVVYRSGKDKDDLGQQVWLPWDVVYTGYRLFETALSAYHLTKRLEEAVK